MLAGAQSVDAEIYTVTCKLPLRHIPDFDQIGEAAGGFDPKIRENRMLRSRVRNTKILCSCAHSAPIDLVLVRCSPVMNRGYFDLKFCFFCHNAMMLFCSQQSKLS